MATLFSLRCLLITLTVLLFNQIIRALQVVDAPNNAPELIMPEGLTSDEESVLRRKFQDAIYLAKHTVLHWPCDPGKEEVFIRYFEPTDANFVEKIFRAIANIDFSLELTDKDAVEKLASKTLYYNAKFSKLSISFLREHPRLRDPGVPLQQQSCGIPGCLGFVVPTEGGASALMSICPAIYWQLPMLADIETPQEWAIDLSKDQSKGPQYYDGYGCDNLGDTDSIWTSSTGSLLLHEIMHFPGLFYDVPGYTANIATFYDENTPHFISDYSGMWPQDGYGPYSAVEIKRYLPLDFDDFSWKLVYNADNYVMYAVSKYYSQKCNKMFKEAPSQDDAAKGRLPQPYPFANFQVARL